MNNASEIMEDKMESRADFFGNRVFVGDRVVINPPTYKGLVGATVVKFTPKGFTVTYFHQSNPRVTNVSQLVKRIKTPADAISPNNP